jgi:hypothetical protein
MAKKASGEPSEQAEGAESKASAKPTVDMALDTEITGPLLGTWVMVQTPAGPRPGVIVHQDPQGERIAVFPRAQTLRDAPVTQITTAHHSEHREIGSWSKA